MTIWADADSLPREVKELIGRRTRGAEPGRVALRAAFVANKAPPLPPGRAVEGFRADDADAFIMERAEAGDLVVTRDIPLAARALERGLIVLNDRGELWDEGKLRERLSLRDHAAALRDLGLAPPVDRRRSYGPRERAAFANALDKALVEAERRRKA